MRLPGHRLATRTLRWVRSRLSGGIAVLGYHRVCEDADDPLGLAISPDEFSRHIHFLARHTRPLRLEQAVEGSREGRPPTRAVVVTLDDGYADTLAYALPVLERFEVPATVFVTTGNPGAEFWWDELARRVTTSRGLPAELHLDIRGVHHSWLAGPAPTCRLELLRSLVEALEPLSAEDRYSAMQQLRSALPRPRSAPGHRSLRAAELRLLAGSPMIDIGAHSVSHPALAALPEEEQMHEVSQSRATLESIVGREVRSFSYPHGSHSAITRRTVKAAGFRVACCSIPDMLTRSADPFAVPRLWLDRLGSPHFQRSLKWWLTP